MLEQRMKPMLQTVPPMPDARETRPGTPSEANAAKRSREKSMDMIHEPLTSMHSAAFLLLEHNHCNKKGYNTPGVCRAAEPSPTLVVHLMHSILIASTLIYTHTHTHTHNFASRNIFIDHFAALTPVVPMLPYWPLVAQCAALA